MRADAVMGGERTELQWASLIVGAVFLLVGILGFIPGITTNYGDMKFAGHESGAELLGIFQTSILHNIVHLAFGIAGILASRTWDWSRNFLIGGGAIYLVLWIYGLLVGQESGANFVPTNTADDWLVHFALGIIMIGAGYALSRRVARPITT
jgi:hypothetical protein